MFIVKQKISGKDYYYLRKSVREGSKVKSKYVAYLGKDLAEAEKKAAEIIEKAKKDEGIINPEPEPSKSSNVSETDKLINEEKKAE
ncbi:Uncharacterised protein [uncultured archaeon]|nr:Uncharacterised protein [uncultured archaeon]